MRNGRHEDVEEEDGEDENLMIPSME